MRTTLEIRDDLMHALLARHPGVPKGRAVELAIEAYLSHGAAESARKLAGQMHAEDWSAGLRRSDRRT